MSTQQPFIIEDMLSTCYDAVISLLAIAAEQRSGQM